MRQHIPLSILTLLPFFISACGEGTPGFSTKQDPNRVPLNDTGVTFYLDYQTFNRQLITGPTGLSSYVYSPDAPFVSNSPTQLHSQMQDAAMGRDAQENGINFDGANGFSFTKLEDSGSPLDPSATEWSCVRDNHTGLVWERKTQVVADIHFGGDMYQWHDSNPQTNGGYAGQSLGFQKDAGGLACGPLQSNGTTRKAMGDTQAFVNVMNTMKLCGFDDWRLPLREEFRSLVDYGSTEEPLVDGNFFTSLHSRLHYWTAESNVIAPARAWGFHFHDGTSHTHPKDCPTDNQGYDNGVLVVRGP